MVFEKKTCKRCGNTYRVPSGFRNLCIECSKHCGECGKHLGYYFGLKRATERFKILNMDKLLCDECFRMAVWKSPLKEKVVKFCETYAYSIPIPNELIPICSRILEEKERREREEQELIRKAQLTHAKEILETPTVWTCSYCKTVNRGRYCSNCGAPRKGD